MPRIKKVSRRKRFNYDRNRRKEWKNSLKKATIAEDTVKAAWSDSRSLKQNLGEMGLSYDPNKSLATKADTQTEPIKVAVREELEKLAAVPEALQLRLSEPDAQYCIYMMEKYEEDYKAMARDPKNYYQDTPKQIRNKIKAFHKVPDLYTAYKIMKAQDNGNSQ